MINRYLKQLIISSFQWVILALIIGVVVSQLLHSSEQIADWQLFFKSHQWLFLLIHALLLFIFYLFWPRLVIFYVKAKKLTVDEAQLTQVVSARNYLTVLFVVLELLFQLRS